MSESTGASRRPPFDTPLERLLFWVEVVTRPVVGPHGPANDEPVNVEARDLYNLRHALNAYDEAVAKFLGHGSAEGRTMTDPMTDQPRDVTAASHDRDCECESCEEFNAAAQPSDSSVATERRLGLIWGGSTPRGQRFYGIDFGWFAIGVLLDG